MMTKQFLIQGDGNDEDGRPKDLVPIQSTNSPAATPNCNGRNDSPWTTLDAEFWPAKHRASGDLKRGLHLFVTGLCQMMWGILQMVIGGMIGLAQDIWIMVTQKRNAAKKVPVSNQEK